MRAILLQSGLDGGGLVRVEFYVSMERKNHFLLLDYFIILQANMESKTKTKRDQLKEKTIEVTLWEAANKLRGSVEPAEYKHVVLGLIFLKFANDKFEEHRTKLIAEGKEKYIEMADFYNMSNVFFLEETSRWSYLIKKSKQNDIALIIDTALHTIEKNNKALKGALPDNYFSRLGLDVTKLASLLDTINDIDTTKDPKQDVVGKV